MVQLHTYEILRVGALPNVLSGHSSSVIIQETGRSEKDKRSEKENSEIGNRITKRSESEKNRKLENRYNIWTKKSEKVQEYRAKKCRRFSTLKSEKELSTNINGKKVPHNQGIERTAAAVMPFAYRSQLMLALTQRARQPVLPFIPVLYGRSEIRDRNRKSEIRDQN